MKKIELFLKTVAKKKRKNSISTHSGNEITASHQQPKIDIVNKDKKIEIST